MSSRRSAASLAQHGIWFTERAGIARTAYHLPLVVRFHGRVDVRALADACQAVVERHPALGSAFEERGGVPYVVRAATAPRLAVQDLSSEPDDLDRVIAREVERPFDLRRGPLVRLTLLSLAPDRAVLLVVAHHLVFDGESKDVLLADLSACYASITSGQAPDHRRPPDPHDGHAARERDGLAAARGFWRERWQQPPDVVLPGLGAVGPAAAAGARLDLVVEDGLRALLASAAESLGVSRFELLLAALQALLVRYGNREVVVAVDLSTRTPEIAGCAGLFANELPLAARPSPAATFQELVQSVRAGLRELYGHRGVPLAQAAGGVRPRASLAPVSVSYRRRADSPAFPGLETAVDWMTFNGTARNALHLQVVDEPCVLRLSWQHSPGAIDGERVAGVAGHYLTLLGAAVAAPGTRLRDLPLLTAPERERLVPGWTGTTPAATLPELFEAQADRTPDAPAVVWGERCMTYADLDAAANRLALRLREAGASRSA
jgi:hypothetical protein